MTIQEYFSLWSLFGDATLTGAFLGMALGVLGVHVILRRMVFLTAAVSQTASLGVVLAVFIASGTAFSFILTPTVGAFIMTLGTLGVVHAGRRSIGETSDALLGVMYLLGAAGTAVLAARVQMELQDLNAMLFGTAVAVLREDFIMVATVCTITLLLQAWWWRGFVAATMDADGAHVRGLPVRLLDAALFLSLALLIALSTRVLGPLPTFAFSVLPPFAALRLSKNIPEALILATVLGGLTGFLGYMIATIADSSVGATQTLVGVALVLVAEGAGRLRRLLTRTSARKQPA